MTQLSLAARLLDFSGLRKIQFQKPQRKAAVVMDECHPAGCCPGRKMLRHNNGPVSLEVNCTHNWSRCFKHDIKFALFAKALAIIFV